MKRFGAVLFGVALLWLSLHPLAIGAEQFSFSVFGDNRDGDRIFQQLIEQVNRDPEIRFGVNCGDLTPRGTADEYRKYQQMVSQSKVTIHPVIGNHDIVKSRTNFEKFLGPRYRSFDYENAHFVSLDNVSQRGLGEEQWAWLENDLRHHTKDHAFVFLHKPLVDPSDRYKHYVMRPPSEVERLIQLFQETRVRYVIFGHIHGYGRVERDNLIFLLSGGAGSPLYLPPFAGGFHHFVKITVNGNRIVDQVVPISLN